MELELWKPAPVSGYEVYHISTRGRLKNTRTGRIMKPGSGYNGYLRYIMSVNNKQKSLSAHRLVALAFLPDVLNKNAVNHKDGNKQNNRVDNLEWATQSENQLHAVQMGLQPVGSQTSWAKLNERDIVIIRRLIEAGVSQRKIAHGFGVTQPLIGMIHRGQWWKHVVDEAA